MTERADRTTRRPCRRRLPLLLLLSLTVAAITAAEDGPWARTETLGLSATVARALNRIRESRRDVRLSDDLWFEAVPAQHAYRPPPADSLIGLADSVFDTHRLSWRNALLPGMAINVRKDRWSKRYVLDVTRPTERADDSQNSDTRTFGIHRRRLQLVMLPIMYKLGVITTLLTGLTVLSLKGVTIGVILLIMAVTSVATKVSSKHGHYVSYGSPYDPFDRSSSPAVAAGPANDKNIHVHVHTAPGYPAAVSSAAAYGPPYRSDDGVYANRPGDGVYANRPGEGVYANRPVDDYYNYDTGTAGPPTTSAAAAAHSPYYRWLG